MGCTLPKPLDIGLTDKEQDFFKSIVLSLPLDSLNRSLSIYPLTFRQAEIGYWVNLYPSTGTLKKGIIEKHAHAIAEFVSTQPIKEGRIITCTIVYYKRGDELGETSFSFKINKEGYTLSNMYLDNTLMD